MKKRVLVFIEDDSYSYDNRVLRETAALVENGWDVTVISHKYPDDPYYKVLGENLRAYYFPKITAESKLGHIIEHSMTLLTGSLLTFWIWLRHGFDIFHACNPMDIMWIIALPYRLIGKKFIFDQHDLCPELFLSRGDGEENSIFFRILILMEKASYTLADTVIATNESYKDVAIKRGHKKPEQVFVVRNGPDLTKFSPVPPRTDLSNTGKIHVGYIGNMNLQDGVINFIDAATEIVSTQGRHNVVFVLIGHGTQYDLLVAETRRRKLEENILFMGRIPDDEMLPTLCACDICVQPDPVNPLNDKSTMNKAMEYMALSKPVVAYDLKETRVSCGDAALYAEKNEAKYLADKILELVDDPELRATLGARGRKMIEERLAWTYSIPNLIAAYESASGIEKRTSIANKGKTEDLK